ncbi:general transcription factor IIE subunit 1-like [Ptychodera flava]|uniref:general transcription factor IIE subunit 1-like n=1 Tax=Ptychodera flava TaxID=63121 RepID=UPI00396A9D3E
MSAMPSEPEVLTSVPSELKKLAKYVVRGFYGIESALVIDILIVNPCIQEEELGELLKFDKKQLRSILNHLKNDKFIKQRMRVETQADGRTNRHNYYFINYKILVNVVKYKLDRMRQKLENEERDSSCKASFKCPTCEKTFNDFDAKDLYDPFTGEMKCTYCQSVVEEDESSMPKKDSRTQMARFNEEMRPLYDLLRETEDVKLAPEVLEPEPMSVLGERVSNRQNAGRNPKENRDIWSGEATRNKTYDLYDQTVTVNMNEDNVKTVKEAPKERPVWMTESTIEGAITEQTVSHMESSASGSAGSTKPGKTKQDREEIMRALLAHERKGGLNPAAGLNPTIPGAADSDDSDSSDSDEDPFKTIQSARPSTSATMEADSDDDDDEEELMVTIGNMKIPLNEVTDDMVAKMTPGEKEAYIKMGQEAYAAMYEY